MSEHSPLLQRFLDYVRINTQSAVPDSEDHPHPTTQCQLDLIQRLRENLAAMKVRPDQLTDVADGSFLVYFPPTEGHENVPNTWLAAHVDTYPGVSGKVNPLIHHYEGGDLALPNNDVVIPAEDLEGLEGKTLVTGDGTSLLGADDKGGVAILAEKISDIQTGKIKSHGPLTFWFCVDEEIGELGFKFLERERIESCDLFLTVDGGRIGHIDVGGFVCRQVQMVFKGQDAHPGEYPHKLRMSHYAAMHFGMLMTKRYNLPKAGIEDPLSSYFYVHTINGGAGETKLVLAPRAFKMEVSDEIMELVKTAAQEAADKYDCSYEITQDRLATVNNEEAIRAQPQYLELIHQVHRDLGIETQECLVRGGTDGSMLNTMLPNIPTPNIGYGSINLHGEQETLVVEELELCSTVVHHIILGLLDLSA